MKTRTACFGLITLGVIAATGAAERLSFELLSGTEYRAELAARTAPGSEFVLKSADPNAPTITVRSPDRAAPIHSPVDIDARFKAAKGATINLASLKVLYGFLQLDVTRRILDAPGVQVSAAGLKVNGARLPSGRHKLTIQLADNFGRTGSQLLEFTIQ
jgi:hypothetical protein